MENNNWSLRAREAARPVYEAITRHPFVTGLIDGSLSRSRFLAYLSQDSLYLNVYTRVLTHIASRLDDDMLMETFLEFAREGIAVEKEMHRSFLRDTRGGAAMSPACKLYTSVLQAAGTRPVAVEAASVLPCFMVYQAVGQYILDNVTDPASNPYRQWIETYADPTFAESTRLAADACDRLAAESTAAVREEMTEAFVLAARLEWMFWDSAYKLEEWPV